MWFNELLLYEMIIIKTTSSFEKKSSKEMTEEAIEELYDYLEEYPESGSVISGTGGVRKLRWKTGKGGGKRGGVRILYHYSKDVLILLLTVYSKSDKENITQKEKNELKVKLPKLINSVMEDL